ncbi:MAG: hypothetical protein KatS3mg113_0922 [Planctomycetaceae bacterium]|nr:MAG: hypothetical protein KatS3mg113_0922 [Planctomycetaceae bacterium]
MSYSLDYTAQQRAAISCRQCSVVLSAGAGCGKTFVLTQRFLSHLLPPQRAENLSRLIALTFTERAAREMRDRIRAECGRRMALAVGDELQHWWEVLRGLEAARISTIHSFCAAFLRRHAVLAKLDPQFHALEPEASEGLIQQAVEECLLQFMEDWGEQLSGQQTDELLPFDPQRMWEPLTGEQRAAGENLGRLIIEFGIDRLQRLLSDWMRDRFRIDWSRWHDVSPETLYQRWLSTWHQDLVPLLLRELIDGPACHQARELLATLVREGMSHHRWGELCALLSDARPFLQNPASALARLRDLAKIQGIPQYLWPDESLKTLAKQVLERLRKEIDELQELLQLPQQSSVDVARLSLAALLWTRRVAEHYEKMKLSKGVLDFDDLLLYTQKLLREHPDICQQWCGQLELLLVDEFQDTDPIQADIVRLLCGGQVADGKLFLVGDVNQSIYGFRRADPTVFQHMREEIPETGRLSLTENFRSQPAILNFVNYVFQGEFRDYQPLIPFHTQQLSPQPCVEFMWVCEPADSNTNDGGAAAREQSSDTTSHSRVSLSERRRWEADWIARRLCHLLADQTPRVRDKLPTGGMRLRRVEARDVVILFRAMSDVAVYEAALQRYGLDYYLVGGKAFFAQQEVYDILNLCRCLEDPADSVALIGVLRSPLFGINDDTLLALKAETKGIDWSRLEADLPPWIPPQQRVQVAYAAKVLQSLRSHKDRLSLGELLREAIDLTGYDAALLSEHLGERKLANLRKLIEFAERFESSGTQGWAGFTRQLQRWVIQQSEEEFATTQPETGNVIRLMTIHQAKGLEFPVVVIADLNRRERGGRQQQGRLHPEWGALFSSPATEHQPRPNLATKMFQILQQESERAEALRLLYVALTRAKDHLILSASFDDQRRVYSPAMHLLARKFDLLTGLPRHDPYWGSAVGARLPNELPQVFVHRSPPQADWEPHHRQTSHALRRVVEEFEQASADPLPKTLQTYYPDRTVSRYWTVSDLEERAAALFRELRSIKRPSRIGSSAEIVGSLVHELLEQVDVRHPESIRELFEQRVQHHKQVLSPKLTEQVRKMLELWLESEVWRPLTSAVDLQREVEFLLPWEVTATSPTGERLSLHDCIQGKIDCCYRSPEGDWYIVDYKTGNFRSARADTAIMAPYRFQLGVYALAVKKRWGQRPAQVNLVTFQPTCRVVSWIFDEQSERRVERWLNAVLHDYHNQPSLQTPSSPC